MPVDYGKRIPCDPRVVNRIMRSPQMVAEQGSTFLASWGGPNAYQMVAKLPMPQRATYYAVESGLQTSDAISIATDLSVDQVDSALVQLEKKGLVSIEVAPKEL